MHVSAYDNMRRCVKRHVLTDATLGTKKPLRVLDVGGTGNSYRSLFTFTDTEYVIAEVGGTSVVSGDRVLDHDDGSFDVVITGQTLEYVGNFWRLVDDMVRVVSAEGVMIVVAASGGVTERDHAGSYRFLLDSYPAIADASGLTLVEAFQDPRGPWHNQVGVFRKGQAPAPDDSLGHTFYMPLLDGALQNDAPSDEIPDHELNAGAAQKLPFLRKLHKTLQPRFYFEIGVFDGASLRLTECPAIGVDPDPCIVRPLEAHQSVHTGISADFFGEPSLVASLGPMDLSYIDGMHLIENAFEDFVNVEAVSHPLSVILVDDIYPNHPQQGLRSRSSRHWTGDVWKIIHILRERRPELILLPVDTFPTGTLVVLGADPGDTTLWEDWDVIVTEAIEASEIPPAEILERHGVLHPDDPLLWRVMAMLRDARDADDPAGAFDRVRSLIAGAFPRKVSHA